ncbi:DUF2563 family protein [Mycobacterium lacus]|uniref:Uncharacterized protein n=1 Tax=Mycobacterium lacus TaxID=169765 RepID=A0A1X1YE20_9MYCO|nr:DUF2563 family protein [Mycobacterium lacus]MCV7121688.1 DUF2563 family protein [Mycobacterium lacus]ORW09316.1 hypothetical protein AWC15_17985 [Mycobacterium lacus]BBX96783.1 hypothetical protein MLAC_20770 [Mycobacterium lacus]
MLHSGATAVFSDFPAVETFHDAVSAAHARHVRTLRARQEALTEAGRSGHRAAMVFTDMDDGNAIGLRVV